MAEKIQIPVEIGSPATAQQVDRIAASVGRLSQSVDNLGKEATENTSKWERFRSAINSEISTPQGIGNLATGLNSLISLAQQAVGAVRAVGEAAAEGERSLTAVNALGSAYDEVTRATNGTVTATEAYATQQRLVQSGLQVSGAQLAAITRAAREYARATGTEATQATEQLTDALRGGSAEELQRFGIAIQSGADRTVAFAQATEQLARTQSEAAPAARTLAEDMTRTSTAATEAASAFATMASDGLGLQGVLSSLGDTLNALVRDIQGATQAARQARATEAEVAARQRALDERRGLVREMQAQLRAAGASDEAIRSVAPSGEVLMRSSPQALAEANARMRAALDAARAAGPATGETISAAFGRTARDTRLGLAGGTDVRAMVGGAERGIQRLPSVQEAAQGLIQTAGEITTQLINGINTATREAVIEVTGSRRAPSGGGGARPTVDLTAGAMEAAHREAQARRGTGISAPTMATMFEQAAAVQEVERTRRSEARGADIARQSTAITDALAEQARATQALSDAQEGMWRPGGVQGDEERLRLVREQAQALRELLTQTDATIAQARERGASESEINGLLSQRVGLEAAMAAKHREASALERERMAGIIAYRDTMVSNLGGVAEAFGAATEAAINGEMTFGAALQKQLRAMLVSLAKQSVVEGLKNLALGFSALSNPVTAASAPGYFKAAGLWAATGVAAGAGAAAIPQASTAPASASSARPSAAQARPGGAGAESSGPLVLNISVSGALYNEGVEEAVVRSLDRAASRGLVPRSTRTMALRGMG